jgi:retron-type reverse transcriptase
LQVLIDESWRGRRWVVETDIANCFEAIPHSGLMQAIQERVCDRAVLSLVRGMLRAGVMQDGWLRRSTAGTPQGGVISPLLCNVSLHRLDRAWVAGEHGVLVRYADDGVTRMRGRWRCRRSNLPSNAARVMEVGPPWSPCRRRSQTTARCAGE